MSACFLPGTLVRTKRWGQDEENSILAADDHAPLPDEMTVDLKAGDGVAYILPLLHFGSRYSTKTRRTLHGGYSVYADLPGMAPDSAGHLFAKAEGRGYLAVLPEPQHATFRRWAARSEEACAIAERLLRCAGRCANPQPSSHTTGADQTAVHQLDTWKNWRCYYSRTVDDAIQLVHGRFYR